MNDSTEADSLIHTMGKKLHIDLLLVGDWFNSRLLVFLLKELVEKEILDESSALKVFDRSVESTRSHVEQIKNDLESDKGLTSEDEDFIKSCFKLLDQTEKGFRKKVFEDKE